jgi:hypothetical protein
VSPPTASPSVSCGHRGIEALAAGLRENRSLKELKLANQRVNFTQQAEERLAEALESNHCLTRLTIDLRNTHSRELINKYLQRNQVRQQRRASKRSSPSPLSEDRHGSMKSLNVADWAAEAERVGSSAQLQYGVELEAKAADEKATCYVLAGSKLWGQATELEKLAVVRAFGTNCIVQRVDMANAMVGDALGQVWGDALKSNTTLTALNLESNAISTGYAQSPHTRRLFPLCYTPRGARWW